MATDLKAGSVQVELADEGIDTLFGVRDQNLGRIERAFGVRLTARGSTLQIDGESAEQVGSMLRQLSDLVARGQTLSPTDIETAIRVTREAPEMRIADFFVTDGTLGSVRQLVNPRSVNQYRYLKAMSDHDLVVSVGPAGTGKTYLAVAMAAALLKQERIRRIILARPAVEAGEKLGFLPGDLVEKVNPYLRPLYDALYDIIGFDQVGRMLDRGIIEVAPIAFMRGRTLNDSFVILDEAQNTTSDQMKMFLTRIGFNSKAVVNGDVTQVDLPSGRTSGLKQAEEILRGIEGIEFVYFDQGDVVRHRLVQKIIGAYADHDARLARDTIAPKPTEETEPH
jgi:phosphate starvation-inducible PhoH-like protein